MHTLNQTKILQTSNMSNTAPIYEVDISHPTCWNELVREYKSRILLVFSKMKPLIEPYLGYAKFAYSMYFGTIMYKSEIEEISKILEISFVECLILQLTYELHSACTSAILPYEGDYIHFRTMDWDLPELKDITVQLKVLNNGKHVFDAVGWVGGVGIFTGIKPNRYTLSLNYRRNANPSLLSNLMGLFSGHYPHSYFIRELLTSDASLESIQKANFISPAYYTVLSDTFKGTIVRDRTSYTIKNAPCIQTNCDSDGVGENICYSFERLNAMQKFLDSKFTIDELIADTKKFPVNNEETLYTVIMTPRGGMLYYSVKS